MVAPRPDDIPGAIRSAFSEKRLIAAWQMLSLSEGNNRLAALGGVERILASRGLELADIATVLAASPPEANPVPNPNDPGITGFGSMFAHMAEIARQRAANANPQPKSCVRSVHIQGKNVPQQIHGRVEVLDERPSRTGNMLVFQVTDTMGDAKRIYGPIAAFSEGSIAKLKKAGDKDNPAFVSLKIRPPAHPNHMPSVQAVWFS